jgi:branched-chain amino acid aminotransferase
VTAVIDDAGSLGTRARLRITVTAPRIDRDARTTLVVTLGPAPEWPDTTSIARVPWLRQDHSSIAGLKTTSYAQNSLALAVARRSGASEAVLADTAGRLCEGAGSNVFVVLDGEILTPDDSSGCLSGVTRGLVLEWAAQVAPVRAVPLPIGVLDEADEVFLTSSTREVHPVDRIDGRDRAVGDISHELRQLFRHNADAVVDP